MLQVVIVILVGSLVVTGFQHICGIKVTSTKMPNWLAQGINEALHVLWGAWMMCVVLMRLIDD